MDPAANTSTHDFVMHMHKCLTGIEIDKREADDVFDYDNMTHVKVVGKITAPDGLGYLDRLPTERNLPGGVRKAAVVAPYEVVVAGRDQLDAITPQMPAVTELINYELRTIADEGCPTSSSTHRSSAEVNMGMMTAKQAADLIAPCFEGVKATRSLHSERQSGGPADLARATLRALGRNFAAAGRRRRRSGVRGQILLPIP